jgi:hypothetical protein
MSRDTTVLPFRQPEAIDDPLSELHVTALAACWLRC